MIQSSTLEFLAELKENNHKEWFDANRDRYHEARDNFIDLVDHLIEGIVEFDPGLEGLEPKQCLFRINRDIRFSKNKNPYKINLAGYMARDGRKSPFAGYYIHIQPGECFLGGGAYHPASPELKKIRSHIDMTAAELREITSDKKFEETFGELIGDSLKTAPAGFPKDHPQIDLIRRKDFFVTAPLTDQDVLSDGLVDKALNLFKLIFPLNDFLNEAIEK